MVVSSPDHIYSKVCGEPCNVQKCVVCLPAEQQADIVDFILQRRLSDIDLNSTDISDRLITLACGHMFTAETLDGHCNMNAFYNVDEMGRFLSTKAPPVNYQTPPTCPTCRGPITALRYGRVTKRATLDILEQNVAGTMSRQLEQCSPGITQFTSEITAAHEQAKKLPEFQLTESSKLPAKSSETNYAEINGPLPSKALDQEGMQKVHGIVLEEARAWYKIVKPIVTIYRKIEKVAATRGAHVKAYEAALTTLYRLEMQEIANDPARAVDAPEPLALANVDHKIGQPPPKADVRFQIEAFFLTLEIRALIAQLAQSRVAGLPVSATAKHMDAVNLNHRAQWVSFVTFVYRSCVTDCEKAENLARESSASRQVVRASIHRLRFGFEQFRWETTCAHEELVRTDMFDVDAREKFAKRIRTHKNLMLQSLDYVQQAYLLGLPSTLTLEDQAEEREWLGENCRKKVETWRGECVKLEEYITKGGTYQPLSTQELEDIVRSFNFSASIHPSDGRRHSVSVPTKLVTRAEYRGHFYNCQNGHTFVITEVRTSGYQTVFYTLHD